MIDARHDHDVAGVATRLVSGLGHSSLADSHAAGAAATADAVGELHAAPALVIVYAGRRHDAAAVLAGVRELTGDAVVVGANTDEYFADGVTRCDEGTVTVLAMTAGSYRFGAGSVATADGDDGFEAACSATRQARAQAGDRLGHAAVLVFGDASNHRHQRMLAGVHHVAGASVPIAGGGFGDSRWQDRTALLHGDTVVGDRIVESGIVVVWISSPGPLTVSVEHGWEPVGLPQLITATDDAYIEEIEGRPAIEVFRAQFPELADDPGTGDVPESMLPWTVGLGLIEPDQAMFVRGIVIEDDVRIRTHTPLPSFAAVQFCRATPSALLGVNDAVVRAAIGDRAVGAVLVFSCVGRLRALGERAPEEAMRVDAAAGVHNLGLFSYGEFARVSGITGYHNSTVVALAL